jgi:hypothetical protein
MTAFGEFTIYEGRTEKIVEPAEVEEGIYWDTSEQNQRARNDCDLYDYKFNGMFGKTAKVKAILPYGSSIIINDYGNEFFNEWYDSTAENDYEIEKEFPITSDDFELRVSCVRTDGLPQVSVVSTGGGAVESVNHTACFDGSIAGEYVDEELTAVRFGGFAGTNFTKISLPNCTELKESRNFAGCPNLEVVELPNITTVFGLDYTFYASPKIESVSFPELEYVSNGTGGCFQGCTNLKRVDFPKLSATTISNYTFRNCTNLETIIIGGNVLCPLSSTNAVQNAGLKYTFYVPDDLVDDYKAATNWATIASKIKPLSELEG